MRSKIQGENISITEEVFSEKWKRMDFKIDLLKKFPLLDKFDKSRYFQNLLVFPFFIVFYLILIAGFFGTPVGNKNIAIVFIWILWWFLLIAILVPFASRIWCTVCPLPFWVNWPSVSRFSG